MDYDTPRRSAPLSSRGAERDPAQGALYADLDEQDLYGNDWLLAQVPETEADASADTSAETGLGAEVGQATDGGYQGPVYDLANLDPGALEALQHGDATQRRIARTIAEAQETYQSILHPEEGPPGRVVVTTSEGNGGQPVLVIVPPGYSADGDTAVHTHYHGDNTTVGAEHGTTGRDQAILDAVRSDPQTILVLPEDQGAPTRGDEARYSAHWGNATDQPATTADALRAVGQDPEAIDARIVSAHSAGGAAIRNLARTGSLEADELLLHDCFYGRVGVGRGPQGPDVLDWLLSLPEEERPRVSYYRAGTDRRQTEGYSRTESEDPVDRRSYSGSLGDAGYQSAATGEDGESFNHNGSLTQFFGRSLFDRRATPSP